ncbi:MAG TPA: hypothetical protein ENH10_02955 [Bacteroidetes bacterium]|nr:hypothetical protein BMS3Bbin04_01602 [bacterium BMS3Bbin04]HDO64975.1 hypothetical protein [Bacteroidota bacterium]HEX04100.1 hypothetical protein [Bacteroidota bacterium]
MSTDGAPKEKIESLKIVFAGTNTAAANQAFEMLHKLTPENFRSDINIQMNGSDTMKHMSFKCDGLTETSFKFPVTAHLWCVDSENPSDDTLDKLMQDCRGLGFFITDDLEMGKIGLADMDRVLHRVGSELKKTPILILPPPGDAEFEPMAKALDRPVRNLFDSEPDTGYRLFLAFRILINRNLPEQPPLPMAYGGQYNYQSKPPQSSLLGGDDPIDGGEDLFLPPDEAISRGAKKSKVKFSDDAPQGERRRGLFGRLMGKKKDK